MAACIGVFMMAVFIASVRKMLHEDKINDKLLDLELVTVDDYTTQTQLDPKIYKEFKETLQHDSAIAPIMEFKRQMSEKICDQMDGVEKTDIIDIHFGFNNSRLLDLAEKRADILKAAEFEKL